MRKRAIAAVGLLLLSAAAASAQAPDGTATHVALAVYGVAGFVDVSVTEYAMGKGVLDGSTAPYHEGNPALRWAVERGPVTAAVVKGSMHLAIGYWLLRDHQDHPTRTFWAAVALGTAQIVVDVHNARTIGGGGR